MNRRSTLAAAALISAFAQAAPANALAIFDPKGDFLASHAGPSAGDLDIEVAEVILHEDRIFFGGALFGDVRTTPGATYVWGIDRGAGSAGLFGGTPPVGPGVTFDAVLAVKADRTGTLMVFNEIGAPTVTNLTENVFAFETLVGAIVTKDLLPSRGFAFEDYRYNFWTRSGSGNPGIADLALDRGTFAAVPEPQSWALMIAGFGLAGWRARRSSETSRRQLRSAAA
jgi:hypothetical protein